MTKKQLYIAIASFLLGFGVTFYVIKTYFPKHKVENDNTVKDTLTNNKKINCEHTFNNNEIASCLAMKSWKQFKT